MPLPAKQFDSGMKKLEMSERVGGHRFFFLTDNGRQVVWTARSHGRGDLGPVENAIRRQLHVNSKQMLDLVNCSMTREMYLAHLRAIGLIQDPQQ